MKVRLKNALKKAIHSLLIAGGKTRVGLYLYRQIAILSMGQVTAITHGEISMRFSVPNALCDWRARTFSEKEPETLEWIDAMPTGSILWDVGANIGLYSVYAAKKRECRVWAFEPSVFNLELLARNIFLNELVSQVCIAPFALSNQVASSQLSMTTTEWGGAMSTFGQDYGWDGETLNKVFEFQTIGLSLDDVSDALRIPRPDFIKMDVDGIEHLILSGGKDLLSDVKGILVEVNDGFREQAEACEKLLADAGLTLKGKLNSEMIGGSSPGFMHCYNQIWERT